MLRIGTAQLHRPARGGAEDARIEGDAVAGRRRAIEIADEARRDVDLDIRPPAAVCIDDRTALDDVRGEQAGAPRSEEHTSEVQSLMRISYAVLVLIQKKR